MTAIDMEKRLAQFFFEIGTMRKLVRVHRQTLLADDLSDNIAAHSYRTSVIGWCLAKREGVDPYKTVMMCLLHDTSEARSGDHNWVNKRYVKIFDDEIRADQLGSLPFPELKEIADEYQERQSKESIVAKDADLLDQILLLKEYAWQGNREAEVWLKQKSSETMSESGNRQFKELQTESAIALGRAIFEEAPSDWWNDIWTNKNR